MTEHEQILSEEGQARRRFLKQAATVAWATPVLVTMMSRAAQASHVTNCGTVAANGGCLVNPVCGSAAACLPAGDPLPGEPCTCQPVPPS